MSSMMFAWSVLIALFVGVILGFITMIIYIIIKIRPKWLNKELSTAKIILYPIGVWLLSTSLFALLVFQILKTLA